MGELDADYPEEFYDREEDRRTHVSKVNRRKYIIIALAVFFVLLLVVGIIIAAVLSNKKNERSFEDVGGRHLTISWYNGKMGDRNVNSDSLETIKNYILKAMRSDIWTQLMDHDKLLRIRFLPYTNVPIDGTSFADSSTAAIKNFESITSAVFNGDPSQQHLAEQYVSYLNNQGNMASHVLMLYAPALSLYK